MAGSRKAWAAVASKKQGTGQNRAVAPRKVSRKGVGSAQTPVGRSTRSKYGAVKTNGYASKKEAKRAAELFLLVKAGEIRHLRYQVRFNLIPASYDKTGACRERAVTYVADFVYDLLNDPGFDPPSIQVVEDVKGLKTKDYIIKRKLMLWIHGIRVREI